MLPYWIKIANITGWKRFKEAIQIIPFKRMEHIRKELDIGYYNNKRIKEKSMSPVQYRAQANGMPDEKTCSIFCSPMAGNLIRIIRPVFFAQYDQFFLHSFNVCP
ncbi:IS3 family transposase [Caldibacillus debilis]|uniref:IS3 family transposase n=1 Tax=Caldibacillus debilis TaxID=301148 RepID=UPI000E3A6422|nr:MAG: hypothetical protein C6W56_07870 [Caldibacillus debilis]